jgi:hypothetical protein
LTLVAIGLWLYMLSGKQEAVMAHSANDDIEAKLIEAQEMLAALEGGNLHIGRPFEGRTEAKMYDLRRKIAEYQAILDKKKNDAPRS